ncbi:Protein TBF1 [Nakaseomyces bracarensis]|uniref:Protein TBF1 n=1 Tax=Nakaseomyces bracarensis TaxID=273131 RepID=A0ABR4NU47_9SACH
MMTGSYSEIDGLNRFSDILNDLPVKTRLALSSLSLLDNVSTQLLRFLISNSNTPNVIAVISNRDNYVATGESEIFHTLVRIFKNIRDIYESRTPLLNVGNVAPGLWLLNVPPPSLLNGHEAYIISAVRKANLVTFILTVINSLPYGFDFLQNVYLDVFCPNTIFTDQHNSDQTSKFLKPQAIIYLDLKTHAYIASIKEHLGFDNQIPEKEKKDLLDKIFPDDIAQVLMKRKLATNGEKKVLSPSEKEFIGRCERRKENLMSIDDYNKLQANYDWVYFVKELLEYCGRNINLIVWGKKGRAKSVLFEFDTADFDPQILYATGYHQTSNIQRTLDIAEPESNRLTEAEKHSISPELQALTEEENAVIQNEEIQRVFQDTAQSSSDPEPASLLHSDENVDTQLMGSTSAVLPHIIPKSSAVKIAKTKRTWSKEEEEALINGLIELGPAWAKILDLYGPGGKINEHLKNRTQVQLKDKARNWKLHYLKNNKPLPPYLMRVTGTVEKGSKQKKKIMKNASELLS